MTVEDAKKVVNNLRKSGYSDKQIAKSFVNLFVTGKITIEGCNGLLNVLGYSIPEEVLSASYETQLVVAKQMLEEKS